MGQDECIKVLTNANKWITAKQVADKLGQSAGLVNRSLRKLYETGFVERRNIKINNISTKYEWKSK